MGWFHHQESDEGQAYQQVPSSHRRHRPTSLTVVAQFQESDNKAELSHEVISGAAAYEVRLSSYLHNLVDLPVSFFRLRRRMRTTSRRTASPAHTLRPRRFCTPHPSPSRLPGAYVAFSAGFAGAFIDRELETRGVRLPSFFSKLSCDSQSPMHRWTRLTARRPSMKPRSAPSVAFNKVETIDSHRAEQESTLVIVRL